MKKIFLLFFMSGFLIAGTMTIPSNQLTNSNTSHQLPTGANSYPVSNVATLTAITNQWCGDFAYEQDNGQEWQYKCSTVVPNATPANGSGAWYPVSVGPVISATPTFSPTLTSTPAPASSWTATITPTPTTTPTGSWTPIPTYTPTVLATEGFFTYKDYNLGYPQNLSSMFLHQENLLWSDNPENWGLVNPAFTFGMGSHTSLALFGWSDNEQTEWLLNQGTANLFIEQNSNQFVFGNGYLDMQGQWIQQCSAISYRSSISPGIQPGPITLSSSGAATQYDANLPEIQGTPFVAVVPVTYIGTPVFVPSAYVSNGGVSIYYQGASTDHSIYQPVISARY